MLAAFAILSLLATFGWLYLLAAHGWFWLTEQWLPTVTSKPRRWPPVTAVVPARDEAAMLPETLPTLLAQDYPEELTVVLVDDQSTDGTAGVARELGAGLPGGHELLIVEGSEPPPGWAGKVWAMAQGAKVATARMGGDHAVGPRVSASDQSAARGTPAAGAWATGPGGWAAG